MVHRKHLTRCLFPALTAVLLAGATVCGAQTAFSFSMDTSALVGNANGPFSLDFQLTDGSGTNDANNTVTISNFDFGGGAPTGSPTLTGGATGSLSTAVTLTDSSFLNELFQSFTPGNTLSFDVLMSGNVDAGGTPDQFSIALLDGSLNEVPTTDAASAFLTADITGSAVVPETFSGTGAYSSIAPPSIGAPVGPAVPEPGVLPMLATGLSAGALLLRRRR